MNFSIFHGYYCDTIKFVVYVIKVLVIFTNINIYKLTFINFLVV